MVAREALIVLGGRGFPAETAYFVFWAVTLERQHGEGEEGWVRTTALHSGTVSLGTSYISSLRCQLRHQQSEGQYRPLPRREASRESDAQKSASSSAELPTL